MAEVSQPPRPKARRRPRALPKSARRPFTSVEPTQPARSARSGVRLASDRAARGLRQDHADGGRDEHAAAQAEDGPARRETPPRALPLVTATSHAQHAARPDRA